MKVHPGTQFKGKYDDIIIPDFNLSNSQQIGRIGRRTGQIFLDDKDETGYEFLMKDNMSVKSASKAKEIAKYSSSSSSDENSSSNYDESSSEAEETTPDDESNAIEINLEEIKKSLNEPSQEHFPLEIEEEAQKETTKEESVKDSQSVPLFKSKEEIQKDHKQAKEHKMQIEGLSTIKKPNQNDQSLMDDNTILLEQLNMNKKTSYGKNQANRKSKGNQSMDTIQLDAETSLEIGKNYKNTTISSSENFEITGNSAKKNKVEKNQGNAKTNKTIVEEDNEEEDKDDTIEYVINNNATIQSKNSVNDKNDSKEQNKKNFKKEGSKEKKIKTKEEKPKDINLNLIQNKKKYKEEDDQEVNNKKIKEGKKKDKNKKKDQIKVEQRNDINLIDSSFENKYELKVNDSVNKEKASNQKESIIQDSLILPQNNDIALSSSKIKNMIQDDNPIENDYSDGSLPLEKVDSENAKRKKKENIKVEEKVKEKVKINKKIDEKADLKPKPKSIKEKEINNEKSTKDKTKAKKDQKNYSVIKEEAISKVEDSEQDNQSSSSSTAQIFKDKAKKIKAKPQKDKAKLNKKPKKISSSKKKIVSQSEYEKLSYSQLSQAMPKALDLIHKKTEQTFGHNGRYSLRIRIPKLNPLLGEKLQYIHTPEGDEICTIFSSRGAVHELRSQYEIGKPKRRKLKKGLKKRQDDEEIIESKEDEELNDSYSELEEDENTKLLVIKPKSQKNIAKNYQTELLFQIRESSGKNAIIINNKEHRDLRKGMELHAPHNCEYQIKNFSKKNFGVAISLVQDSDDDH